METSIETPIWSATCIGSLFLSNLQTEFQLRKPWKGIKADYQLLFTRLPAGLSFSLSASPSDHHMLIQSTHTIYPYNLLFWSAQTICSYDLLIRSPLLIRSRLIGAQIMQIGFSRRSCISRRDAIETGNFRECCCWRIPLQTADAEVSVRSFCILS